ncbi:MAG TPA: autotransporter-associated beta strand repeat-containing protein, partial [Solirubrobacteraceae bacterium]|nr:autotransporter-associated beta strand repeat-containing protein [Solirubrobacteraceae bacterium]
TADISSALNPIESGGATFDTNGNNVTLASALAGAGALTKAGTGTLTLAGTNTYGGTTDIQHGTLAVSGAVLGPITVESPGTLSCTGGTLNGAITNNGGTEAGAPAAPSGVSATASNGLVTVDFTPGAANCFPVSYSAAASPGGAHASGSGSPIKVAGLNNGTSYTFAVTATNPIGRSTSSASLPVTPQGGLPTATITSPGSGKTFAAGQSVPTSFSCTDASDSPGIASCVDSNGATGGSGRLDTSAPGTFSYTVTAGSRDGQQATASITYTVADSPQVSIASPQGIYRFGQLVRARYTCQDGIGGTGISACTGPAAAGAPVNTSTAGKHRFAVTAISRDGLSTTISVAYTVLPDNHANVERVKVRQHAPDGVVNFSVTVPGPGTVDVLETAWNDNFATVARLLQPARLRFVFARLHQVASRAETLELRVVPNARGEQLMRSHRYAVTIRLWVTYTPSGGAPRSQGFYGIQLTRPLRVRF